MRKYIDNHSDLGPWNQPYELQQSNFVFMNEKSNLRDQQIRMYQPQNKKLKVKHFFLPKMKNLEKVDRLINNTNNKPVKINALKLQIDTSLANNQNEINEARKSKTLSFQPPLISFYNKQHPKAHKRYSNLTIEKQYAPISQRISKLDLICHSSQQAPKIVENLDNNNELYKSSRKSSQRQFAKKRSIKEVFRYIKYHELQKSQISRKQIGKNIIDKLKRCRQLENQSRNDYYSLAAKKVHNYKFK